MVADAKVIRTLVAGTKAMREAGELYLPREPMESDGAYINRKARSVLFNATGKTVADMTGKVFVKPVVLAKDVDANLTTWAENIDLAGRHLNVFARDVFFDALQPGIGFIYVDMPPKLENGDGSAVTLAQEQTANIRPYLKYISLENLIGWKSSTVNGAEVLTQIRIKECATEQDATNEYLETDVPQIRVVTRGDGACTWQTFREGKNTKGEAQWVLYQEGTISIPEIPLVPVYINRTDFMKACPPLAKMAELNVAHWQSSSDQRNILHVARVPILFGAGFEAEATLAVGASEMIRSSNPEAKLEYVEHTGQAIGAGDKDLENLKLEMQNMGLQLLVNTPGQTATGEIRDDAKENSPLAMMAGALQDALEAAFGFMAQFAGRPKLAGGSLTVNKDFGISGNIADWQFITQAYVAGKIDVETYINEGIRRGVFGEDTDPETVKGRLANEAPDLGAGIPPGGGMNLDDPKPPAKKAPADA